MPLYEYTCDKCHEAFELLVRGSERPACPKCGSERLERLLSIPAAHIAGGASNLPVCETPRPSPGGCGS